MKTNLDRFHRGLLIALCLSLVAWILAVYMLLSGCRLVVLHGPAELEGPHALSMAMAATPPPLALQLSNDSPKVGSWIEGQPQPACDRGLLALGVSTVVLGIDGQPRDVVVPLIIVRWPYEGLRAEDLAVAPATQWPHGINLGDGSLLGSIGPGMTFNLKMPPVPGLQFYAQILDQQSQPWRLSELRQVLITESPQ